MRLRTRTPSRWRTIAVLAVGIAIGTTMMATPAGAHFGSVLHFLREHADPRYANAVSGTDKARNADKLDGLDSGEFVRTTGKAADADLLDGIDSSAFTRGGGKTELIFARLLSAGSTKTIFSAGWNGAPNSTTFTATLNADGTTTVRLTYGGAGGLAVWVDDGGASPSVSRLSMGQSVARTTVADQINFTTYYAAFRVSLASFSAGTSDVLTELVEPALITR